MGRTAILPFLALALACGDTPLQPTEDLAPDAVAQAKAAKTPFASQLTLVGPVEPGDVRISHSGVLHGTDLVNEFAMTGDLVGSWFFIGKYHINPNNGKGRSIGNPGLVVITSPMVGTFECKGGGKIENWPTDDFIQYGNQRGCKGTGDYEGMRMKARISNEANPGLGAGAIYDLWGEIW